MWFTHSRVGRLVFTQKFQKGVCCALCARKGSRASAVWMMSPKKRENKILGLFRACVLCIWFLRGLDLRVLLKMDPNIWICWNCSDLQDPTASHPLMREAYWIQD